MNYDECNEQDRCSYCLSYWSIDCIVCIHDLLSIVLLCYGRFDPFLLNVDKVHHTRKTYMRICVGIFKNIT